jgi:ribosomal subunit interface protein
LRTVDIVVKGRHTEVPERFRVHVSEKLAKIQRLDPKVISVDVEVSKERNPRLSEVCERIELTIHSRGPVIRAEAAAQDPYAALDAAFAKLESRLRRAHDRRVVHHGGKSPVSVATATSTLAAADGAAAVAVEELAEGVDDHPMVIREKTHLAAPMSMEQALYEMELVGHDFFLFVDADRQLPSVVYRRHGYDYGVIRLGT